MATSLPAEDDEIGSTRPHHRRRVGTYRCWSCRTARRSLVSTAIVVVGAVLGGPLLAACSAATVAARGGGVLVGEDAHQVVDAALMAAKHAGTVHYVLVSRRGRTTETITGDAGLSSGRQIVTTSSGTVEAMLVDATAYVKGDATGLESVLGLTSAVAGKYKDAWISLSRDDEPYLAVVDAVELDHVLAQVTPSGSLVLLQPARLTRGNERTVGVKGGLPSPVQGASGSSTLYVSTSSPSVPVRFTGTAGTGSKAVHDEATFSQWGHTIDLSAPSGAVSYQSLPSQ